LLAVEIQSEAIIPKELIALEGRHTVFSKVDFHGVMKAFSTASH
jgi:hypothetical protein